MAQARSGLQPLSGGQWRRAAANKAAGNNPAIALLTVVGSKPPAEVVINELTTIASVVTHAQFIDDTTIKGSPLAAADCRR